MAVILAGALFTSANVLGQGERGEAMPAKAGPQIWVDSGGIVIGSSHGSSKAGELMKVTIVGPTGEFLVDQIVPAEGFSFSPSQGDGVYRFEAYILTFGDSTSAGTDYTGGGPTARSYGRFEVQDGIVIIPNVSSKSDSQDLSLNAPNRFERIAGQLLEFFIPTAAAQDLTITDASPSIFFVDDTSADLDWWLWCDGDDESSTQNFCEFRDREHAQIPFRIDSDGNSDDLIVGLGNGDLELSAGTYHFDGGSSNNVGIGTTSPGEELHIVDGGPFLLLEDSSTAQQVFVGHQSGPFLIGTSTISPAFEIDPTVPNGITMNASGNVGLGTDAPIASLNLIRTNGTAKVLVQEQSGTTAARELFKLSNNGGPFFIFENTDIGQSYSFAMGATGHFLLSHQQTAGVQMRLTPAGDMTITGNYLTSSSRTTKDQIIPVDTATVLEKVDQLPIAEWSYLSSPDLRHVGPMAEDWHAAFGLGPDERHVSPTDMAGVALAAVKALRAENHALKLENLTLLGRIERIESQLSLKGQ